MNPTPRIRWSAILLGVAIDFFITNGLGILFTLTGLITDSSSQANPCATPTGPGFLFFTVLGALSTVFGGWLAGRRAAEATWLHGLLVGLIGTMISVILSIGCAIPPSFLLEAILYTFLGAAGGYLARPVAKA